MAVSYRDEFIGGLAMCLGAAMGLLLLLLLWPTRDSADGTDSGAKRAQA